MNVASVLRRMHTGRKALRREIPAIREIVASVERRTDDGDAPMPQPA
jgi:hypothetical protein